MNMLSNLENNLIVPEKYRLERNSKKITRRMKKVSPPCLITKSAAFKKQNRLSSMDVIELQKDKKIERSRSPTVPKRMISGVKSIQKSKKRNWPRAMILGMKKVKKFNIKI